MHIIIDIRTLQLPHPRNNSSNNILRKWLSAFLKMPSEDKVTLLVDPRFEWPQLDVPLTGSYWKPISFKSHLETYLSPNKKNEQLASYKTNRFLLEQEADLFHLTNPFLSAIPVGYPPIACPSVVTIDDSITQPRLDEVRLVENSHLGATYYPKVQALQYSTKIIANKQSSIDELAPWYQPTNHVEIIDHTQLSPSEIALVMRKIYAKTASRPFNHTVSNQTASSDSPFGFTQLRKLTQQADTIDYEYKVESKVPLIGPRIAWLQSSMTTHLREAYFDIIADSQISFNKKVVKALESAWAVLSEYKRLLDLSFVQEKKTKDHTSQYIVDEAQQTIQKEQLLNPYILAGPLPEYGTCLERDFYQRLYLASLYSNRTNTPTQIKKANQCLIIHLNRLTEQIEPYYEQKQSQYTIQNNFIRQRELMYEEISSSLSNEFNILWPEYEIQSDKLYIGWLIAGVRRNLTSHLHKSYIDAIFTQQVAFNRLIIEVLCNIDSIKPITLQQVKTMTETHLVGKVSYSDKPIIGSMITFLQKQATSHLHQPYLKLFFERQDTFNKNVVEFLVAMNKKITTIELNQHYYHLRTKNMFNTSLERIKQQWYSDKNEEHLITGLLPDETDLTSQMLPLLIKQMNLLIEERL